MQAAVAFSLNPPYVGPPWLPLPFCFLLGQHAQGYTLDRLLLQPKPMLKRALFSVTAGVLFSLAACRHGSTPPVIAVLSPVGPDQIWLDEHAGVLRAAARHGLRIYWNAPDHQDDVQRQIALVDQVTPDRYAGLVLAPAQQLALMLPVGRALARKLPIVVVSSSLTLPPGSQLAYVLNNEEQTGALAAASLVSALGSRGRIALLGLDPLQAGLMERTRSFEQHLQQQSPGLSITQRRLGNPDPLSSEQVASEVLSATPRVDAVLALTPSAGIGVYQAQQRLPGRRVVLVICGQDSTLLPLLRSGALHALIAQDSYTMGAMAIDELVRMQRGLPVPARVELDPILITSANVNDPSILSRVTNMPDEPL